MNYILDLPVRKAVTINSARSLGLAPTLTHRHDHKASRRDELSLRGWDFSQHLLPLMCGELVG